MMMSQLLVASLTTFLPPSKGRVHMSVIVVMLLQIITSLTSLPHPEYSSPKVSEEGSEGTATAAAADSAEQQQQQRDIEQQQEKQEQQQQKQEQRSERYITLIASTRVPQAAGCPSTFRMRIPKLQGYFTGTGAAAKEDGFYVLIQHTFLCYPSNFCTLPRHE
jgi:hypothetical protein